VGGSYQFSPTNYLVGKLTRYFWDNFPPTFFKGRAKMDAKQRQQAQEFLFDLPTSQAEDIISYLTHWGRVRIYFDDHNELCEPTLEVANGRFGNYREIPWGPILDSVWLWVSNW
jgi:hypothetical protein